MPDLVPPESDDERFQNLANLLSQTKSTVEQQQQTIAQMQQAQAKAEREARLHQSRYDRLQTVSPQAQQPQTSPPARSTASNADAIQQRMSDLEAFANEASRENLLLKEMARRGLSEADVEDVEFTSPTELKLALDVIELKKSNEVLRQSLQVQEPPRASSESVVDTGGPSSTEKPPQASDLATMYAKAKEQGRTPAGRYALLNAIAHDPNKHSRVKER